MSDEFRYIGEHVYEGVHFNFCFPVSNLERIKNEMELSPYDIVLATYPKSGSTWMQEIIYLICNGGDTDERLSKTLDDIYPEVELIVPDTVDNYELVQSLPSPKYIKTHLQSHYFVKELGKGTQSAKFVVAMRNPKDVLVSWYYFHKMMTYLNFKGTFDDFFEMYREQRLLFGDPIDYLVSWEKYKDHPSVMFLRYEDLKEDIAKWVKKLATFLNKPVTEEMVKKIIEFTSFDAMKDRGLEQSHASWVHTADETISPFMRKGIVNDYLNYFSQEQIKYMDGQCKEKCKGTSIPY